MSCMFIILSLFLNRSKLFFMNSSGFVFFCFFFMLRHLQRVIRCYILGGLVVLVALVFLLIQIPYLLMLGLMG